MNHSPQDRNTEGGGLFSDEPTPAKRENPYLRKNRARAKATRTADVSSTAVTDMSEPAEAPAANEKTAPAQGRRSVSQFFSEHVKLITTIVTVMVLLSLVIITDVVGWVEDAVAAYEQKDKDPLTLDYVEALTHKSDPITWRDLASFKRYKTSTAENSVTWFFEVEGTTYQVWISGPSTGDLPTYVRLYDMASDAAIDLTRQSMDEFYNYEPEE